MVPVSALFPHPKPDYSTGLCQANQMNRISTWFWVNWTSCTQQVSSDASSSDVSRLVNWLITHFRNRVPGCWDRVTQIGLYYIFFFLNSCLFMAALCNRAGHIFNLWFLLSFFLSSFFPRLISAVGDWMSTIDTRCGLSVNLQCRSETYCARFAENAARKKSPKCRYLSPIPKLCPALSSQLRHVSTIRKNLVKQQYLLHNLYVLIIWWTSAH